MNLEDARALCEHAFREAQTNFRTPQAVAHAVALAAAKDASLMEALVIVTQAEEKAS